MVTLRMLDFLIDRFRDVAIVYFCVPAVLRHNYRQLARHRGIDFSYRDLEGVTKAYIGGDARDARWGIFACHLPGRAAQDGSSP